MTTMSLLYKGKGENSGIAEVSMSGEDLQGLPGQENKV
jgi:hypothetical protein